MDENGNWRNTYIWSANGKISSQDAFIKKHKVIVAIHKYYTIFIVMVQDMMTKRKALKNFANIHCLTVGFDYSTTVCHQRGWSHMHNIICYIVSTVIMINSASIYGKYNFHQTMKLQLARCPPELKAKPKIRSLSWS